MESVFQGLRFHLSSVVVAGPAPVWLTGGSHLIHSLSLLPSLLPLSFSRRRTEERWGGAQRASGSGDSGGPWQGRGCRRYLGEAPRSPEPVGGAEEERARQLAATKSTAAATKLGDDDNRSSGDGMRG